MKTLLRGRLSQEVEKFEWNEETIKRFDFQEDEIKRLEAGEALYVGKTIFLLQLGELEIKEGEE